MIIVTLFIIISSNPLIEKSYATISLPISDVNQDFQIDVINEEKSEANSEVKADKHIVKENLLDEIRNIGNFLPFRELSGPQVEQGEQGPPRP